VRSQERSSAYTRRLACRSSNHWPRIKQLLPCAQARQIQCYKNISAAECFLLTWSKQTSNQRQAPLINSRLRFTLRVLDAEGLETCIHPPRLPSGSTTADQFPLHETRLLPGTVLADLLAMRQLFLVSCALLLPFLAPCLHIRVSA
jgi:hypothetical protein